MGKLRKLFPNLLNVPGCLPGETPKECRLRLEKARAEGKGVSKTYKKAQKEKES
jgi:hypothetical protein